MKEQITRATDDVFEFERDGSYANVRQGEEFSVGHGGRTRFACTTFRYLRGEKQDIEGDRYLCLSSWNNKFVKIRMTARKVQCQAPMQRLSSEHGSSCSHLRRDVMASFSLRSATASDAAVLARIHREARLAAMPWLPVLHSEAEDLAWMANVVLVEQQVFVASRDGTVLGLLAMTEGWVDHLYVAPPFWRTGTGSLLLARAKHIQRGGFSLWAFQRNAMARAFYRKHGLVELRTTNGQDNEEKEPDVLIAWKPES